MFAVNHDRKLDLQVADDAQGSADVFELELFVIAIDVCIICGFD